MQKIMARSLLSKSTDELYRELKGHFILLFDDGEIQTNWLRTVVSSFAWDIHRRYPKTPMLKSHHIDSIIGAGSPTTDTNCKLLANVCWCAFDHNPEMTNDEVAWHSTQISNRMYNAFVMWFGKNVMSLDMRDYYRILSYPAVREINENLEPNRNSVNNAINTITKVLQKDPGVKKFRLAQYVRTKTIRLNQLLQCITARGYVTDVNSQEFKNPILRGFAQGLRLIHDDAIESRSCAKALSFSQKDLQDSEYFSRKLQLVNFVVKNIHRGDCGSTGYNHWFVKPEKFDEYGVRVYDGDLPLIVGKYYMDDEGKLKVIKAGDKHLIEKTLKLRVVHKCQHPDKYGICSTCFGELSLNVFEGTNIGTNATTTLTKQSTQGILSTKHHDGSTNIEAISIPVAYRDYLRSDKEGLNYYINVGLKGKLTLMLDQKAVSNLVDIIEASDIRNININRTTHTNELGIQTDDGKVSQFTAVPVGFGHRQASFTYDALEYIRTVGWTVDAKGNFVFDFNGWDRQKPLLTLPLRHYNMSDHSHEISDALESTVKELKKRDNIENQDVVLSTFFDLVNTKLQCNLAVLEVVMYGTMIKSAENYDYYLPKYGDTYGLGVSSYTMAYRSWGATWAYQGQYSLLVKPITYLLNDRPNHPFDAIIMPQEVVGRNHVN